jgi:nitrate reductase beta subunit
MRAYMRSANLGEEFDETIPESVRLTGEEIESMYRLLAIAK